jgi:hypothetical protein
MRAATGRPACAQVMRLAMHGHLNIFTSSRLYKRCSSGYFHTESRHAISNFIAYDGDHFWAYVLFCDGATGDGPSNRVPCHPFVLPRHRRFRFLLLLPLEVPDTRRQQENHRPTSLK